MYKDGKLYWARHAEEGYILGRVEDIKSDSITLSLVRNSNETYTANILISVNPYAQISDLYSSTNMRKYVGKSLGQVPPHVYAIGDKAYRDMKVNKESQAIVVSGESGAGKTEATKHILRYLTECYGARAGIIEDRIVESNPLLEAFGNAKTLRNNNSSRFGKFIEIHFSSKLQVSGGQVVHYLLEKSRVVSQNPGERNFHIFYRLCAGAPAQLKQRIYITNPEDFQYLRGGCTSFFVSANQNRHAQGSRFHKNDKNILNDIMMDDYADFQRTEKSMCDLGIDEGTRLNIYSILAGILHLGNLKFTESDTMAGNSLIEQESKNSLRIAASLLGLTDEMLIEALTIRKTSTASDQLKIALRPTEATNARDALAKSIYSRLFDFVVSMVNKAIPKSDSHNYIGVLDIAGFEYFEWNSFEQFCINYCNEKLQQFFNRRILKDEQYLYEREGLGVRKVSFIDNQDCIDLIEKKPNSILDLLDEESRLPKASYSHFTEEVHDKFNGHPRIDIPRKSKIRTHRELRNHEGFLIRHFAGAVCYSTNHFIEKNNDALHASLEMAIQQTENPLLSNLFPAIINSEVSGFSGSSTQLAGSAPSLFNRRNKLNFISVGSKFRTQLNSLMDKLYSTGTSFIRCIKPNSEMRPLEFKGVACLSQLQCSGMIDVLSVMEQGFPSRTSFADLYKMYRSKLPNNLARLDPRLFCKLLFKALGLNETDFRFGTTKVFFRPGKFAEFDEIMKSDPDHLNELVKKVQKWLIRYRWKLVIYCVIEVIKLKNKIEYRRNLHIRIQKLVRGWRVRRRYRPLISGMLRTRSLNEKVSMLQNSFRKLNSEHIDNVIKELQRDILDVREQMISRKLTDPQMIDGKIGNLENLVEDACKNLKRQAEKERQAQEAAKQAAEQLQLERNQRIREEEAQRLRDNEKKAREEMERRRIKEDSEERKIDLEKLKQAEETRKANINYIHELERRDRDLALRISNGDANSVDLTNEQASGSSSHQNSKYAYLTNWTYPELRQTINSSCDMELLAACRDEFHRRIKAYQEWKEKKKNERQSTTNKHLNLNINNNNNNYTDNNSNDSKSDRNDYLPIRAPRDVLHHAATEGPLLAAAKSRNQAQATMPDQDRYFKIPLTRIDCPTGGYWYAHFNGRYVVRQMQIANDRPPILHISGVHDIHMCEIPLEETGLTRRKGAEILAREFEAEWARHGGNALMKRLENQITRPHLK